MTPATWLALRWWDEWKTARVVPFGARRVQDDPAFVLEAIMECERAANAWRAERAKAAHKRPTGGNVVSHHDEILRHFGFTPQRDLRKRRGAT